MVEFSNNHISSSYVTVAEKLKQGRQEKNFSFKKISRKININPSYLKALEEENYAKLPEGIYQTKILKKYASFLELDVQELEQKFLKEKEALQQSQKQSLFSVKRIKRGNFLVFPRIVRNIFTGIIIMICFVCLGVYLNGIFSPPQLKIFSPKPNSIITQKKDITISGKTKPETEIFINNNPILNQKNGFFEKKIDLKKGVNIITVTAQKKYGQKRMIKKQILVQEDQNL